MLDDVLMTEPLNRATEPVSIENYFLKTSAKHSDGLEFYLTKDPLVNDFETCAHMAFTAHSPFELPNAMVDNRDYAPFDYGQSLEVIVTPDVVLSDEKLRRIPPSVRKCYFDGERTLKFHRKYTLRNCEHECLTDHVTLNLNCTPFYMIHEEASNVCGIEEVKLILMHSQRELFYSDCDCLEECNSIVYNIKILSKSFSAKYNES